MYFILFCVQNKSPINCALEDGFQECVELLQKHSSLIIIVTPREH